MKDYHLLTFMASIYIAPHLSKNSGTSVAVVSLACAIIAYVMRKKL